MPQATKVKEGRLSFLTVSIQANELRTAVLDEREYLVAPSVPIVEGVLNRIFYPAEEIGAFVEAWNGIPLPIGHPMRNGEYISANSPDVLEKEVYGRFFNASMDNDRLRGEMWLDIAKCDKRGGVAKETRQRLEDSVHTEVSVGVFMDYEERSGVFKGEAYDGIARNIRPDHIALLPHAEGACNRENGCGVPRANEQEPKKRPSLVVNQYEDGIMIALMVPAEAAAKLALSPDDVPDGSDILPPEELHITLAYLGRTGATRSTLEEVLTLVGAYANWTGRIEGVVSGFGRFSQDVGGKHAIYASFDCPYLGELRQHLVYLLWGNDVAVSMEHAFTPHITLAYIPADGPTPDILPEREEIRFSQLTLAWGDQVTAFQLQGMNDIPMSEAKAAAVNALRTYQSQSHEEVHMNQEETVDVAEVEEVEETTTPVPEADTPNTQDQPAAQDLESLIGNAVKSAVNTAVTAAMAPFQDALSTIRANADKEKEQLVNDLVANERCAFERPDLEAMSTTHLRKLAQSLISPNYGGQGFVPNGRAEEEVTVSETPKLWE